MDKKIHIVFDQKDIPKNGEDYFLFPRTAIESLKSSMGTQFQMFPDWTGLLAESLRSEFEKVSKNEFILHWSINNLFFWRYLYIFRSISLIKSDLDKRPKQKLNIVGLINQGYKVVTNKGDESRPLMYQPELELPFFLKQVLKKDYELNFKTNLVVSIFGRVQYKLRVYIIFFLKLGLLLLVKGMRCLKPSPLKSAESAKVIFIARSLGAAEQLSRLSKELSCKGVKTTLMLDLNLHQGLRFKPQENYFTGDDLVSFWDILSLSFQLFVKSFKSSKIPLSFNNGEFEIKEDVGSFVRELGLASIDLQVHKLRVSRFLSQQDTEVIINGEGISPYIFLYDCLAKKMNIKSLRVQTFPFSTNDAVDFCFSDGLLLDSKKRSDEFHDRCSDSEGKAIYLGDFDFVSHPRERSVDGVVKVIYFSQFHDLENSKKLIEAMIHFADNSPLNIHICVKPHPRDPVDYSIYSKLEVFAKDRSVDECVNLATIVVGRSTSVLARALLFGVPYIVCQLSSADRYIYAPFVDTQLNVVVSSVSEFEQKMRELPNYIKQYYENRTFFVRDNFKEFDMKNFMKLLGK